MLAPARKILPLGRQITAGAALSILSSGNAAAHVKWFCAYDVAGQPRGLENVLCPDFELLVALALIGLTAGCALETTFIGNALRRAMDRVTQQLAADTEFMFRSVCGFFFVALWTTGGIILTPELKTNSQFIPWLQLAIAAGMMSRSTLPFSALGIVALFGTAVWNYGLFHLMDYPIFLGVAAYLALTGLQRDLFALRPLDVARWATAMTLMWASVEKWAYPEWSFPMFAAHRSLTLGYDDEFVMRAAGVIEFTLSFALIWTPLVRRAAAIVLAGMFIGAVFEFGKIDAIGHAPIIAVLLAIIGDRAAKPKMTQIWAVAAAPAYLSIALVGFLALYYAMHAVMFGTTIV